MLSHPIICSSVKTAPVNITASFHGRLAQRAGGHFFLLWRHWKGQTRRKMCIYLSQLRAAVNLCSIVLIMCKQRYFWALPPVSVLLQFAFYRFSFLETSCRLIGYMHTRLCPYIRTSSGKWRSTGGQGTCGTKDEMVRWRLDGYLQTENMEEKPRVLASWRPPWKKTEGWGREQKSWLLMAERKRSRQRRRKWINLMEINQLWSQQEDSADSFQTVAAQQASKVSVTSMTS